MHHATRERQHSASGLIGRAIAPLDMAGPLSSLNDCSQMDRSNFERQAKVGQWSKALEAGGI
jgi:hypothetical protein